MSREAVGTSVSRQCFLRQLTALLVNVVVRLTMGMSPNNDDGVGKVVYGWKARLIKQIGTAGSRLGEVSFGNAGLVGEGKGLSGTR